MRPARLAVHRPPLRNPGRSARPGHARSARACSAGPAIPRPAPTRWRCACAAALHALVRSGGAPGLAALYPPAPLPDERLRCGVRWRRCSASDRLVPWLDRAPQTNEVGRSAVLMAGLAAVAARFGQPIALYELGASAGLNLQLDRYAFDLGGRRAGDPGSTVRLAPGMGGTRRRPPQRSGSPAGRASTSTRSTFAATATGCSPISGRTSRHRLALARGGARHRRRRSAAGRRGRRRRLDRGRLAPAGPAGVTRVVMHSVAFQYFPPDAQARVARHIEAGRRRRRRVLRRSPGCASRSWPDDDRFSLRLRTWPGGENSARLGPSARQPCAMAARASRLIVATRRNYCVCTSSSVTFQWPSSQAMISRAAGMIEGGVAGAQHRAALAEPVEAAILQGRAGRGRRARPVPRPAPSARRGRRRRHSHRPRPRHSFRPGSAPGSGSAPAARPG